MKHDKYGNKKDAVYYAKIAMAVILVFMMILSAVAGLIQL